MGRRELAERFFPHTPSDDGLRLINELTATLYATAVRIDEGVQDSREKSMALTHLEEAKRWAVHGVALQTCTEQKDEDE